MTKTPDIEKKFIRLKDIVTRLTAPDGCPWDREQTPFSLKKYVLEEAYELLEAIDTGDPSAVAEELGDLLFLLLLLTHIYEKAGRFSLGQVLDGIAEKMIRRHPHVYGNVHVSRPEEVSANWQVIKAKEAKKKKEDYSCLGHLPRSLPALQRAFRLGERASRVGFDWSRADDVWEKITEEERELREAMSGGDRDAMANEIGDLLFSISNLSRHLGINPEEALQGTADRFVNRFCSMERQIGQTGKKLADSSLEEMEGAWSAVKASEGK
jgi:MazG family protein